MLTGGGLDPHFCATETVEDFAGGGVVGDIDAEGGEAACEGLFGGVTDAFDLAFAFGEVEDDHGFEDVVDLVGVEAELDFVVAFDEAAAFEGADA